jgi:hypothetical protein
MSETRMVNGREYTVTYLPPVMPSAPRPRKARWVVVYRGGTCSSK